MTNAFNKINLIGGWLIFAVASAVYLATMEPTASFWDCSEFIATSYKLEIGHPPGAPLFMMISRLFTMFGGPMQAAVLVNSMSALASGATVMFLFWSITHLGFRALRKRPETLSRPQMAVVLGSGLIGAMAYAFTDTFWFSAVEGEVYALSSLFTAIIFWAILKWENVADQPHSNRWLILIAYFIGLSIGIHLLSLLVIPPVVLIYYFRKYEVTKWGVVKTLLAATVILIAAMYIIIPGTVTLGAWVDRIFANSFGLPFNTGITVYALVLFALLSWGIYRTHKRGRVLANTILLCVTVIVLGYGTYASVIIRSSANPPMNSNAPNTPYGLLSLLNRDQYGARPLFKGPAYSSPIVGSKEKTVYYAGDKGKYESASILNGYQYAPGTEMLFPRMGDMGRSAGYNEWVKVKGKPVTYDDKTATIPTFGENMKFMFAYQINFLYWRYFFWNFVGRQSDIQSTGEITDGNWLSGIPFIDELFLGPQDNLPHEQATNKGRNVYFFLPFLLGLIGLIFQLNRDGRNFAAVMALFVMTGLAIAVYLNMPPGEPRERDYVFVGSFYAFSIWIGFGVMALYEAASKWLKKESVVTAAAATVICAMVPTILAAQNWDDHDRSGRYVARDTGRNYLNSTLPNSIFLTYGDNDTFPLWYAQEVESVRTDVRVMNMSYLQADWYIDQMRIKSHESEPVPFNLPRSKYVYTNEAMPVVEKFKMATGKQVIDEWVRSDDNVTKVMWADDKVDCIPTRSIAIPVNKANAIASGIVRAEDSTQMVDTLYVTIDSNKSYITREELMLIDLLAHFDWKRPIYFSQVYNIAKLGLDKYLQMDGYGYRLVPIITERDNNKSQIGRVDTEYLYNKLMKEFSYGRIDDPKVYADYTTNTNFAASYARSQYAWLADALLAKGDTLRAVEVLDAGIKRIPFSQIRYSYFSTFPLIKAYYEAGAFSKGNAVAKEYAQSLEEYITHYNSFRGKMADLVTNQLREKREDLYALYELSSFYNQPVGKSIERYFINTGMMSEK